MNQRRVGNTKRESLYETNMKRASERERERARERERGRERRDRRLPFLSASVSVQQLFVSSVSIRCCYRSKDALLCCCGCILVLRIRRNSPMPCSLVRRDERFSVPLSHGVPSLFQVYL